MKGDTPMKKIIALVVALVLTLSLTAAFADGIKIAVTMPRTKAVRCFFCRHTAY